MVASAIWDVPLDSLVPAEVPFLPQDSVTSYTWQTHVFTEAPTINTALRYMGTHPGPLGGVPFVVVVGHERIYLGAFWSAHSSWAPQVPFIELWLDAHQIQKSMNQTDTVDKRSDPRICAALKSAGVLIE